MSVRPETDPAMPAAAPGAFPGVELKQARSRLSTSRLLRASAELIAEGGYERMTLAEVGRRAGYSHGLVTRRFGSKDGLLLALLQKMVTEWHHHEISPVVEERVGLEAIAVSINGIRASLQHDPGAMRALYTLMFEALKPSPAVLHERIQNLVRAQRRGFEESLQRGIAQGAVRPDLDVNGAASLIIAGLRGAAYQWLLEPDFDIDRALALLQEQLERAFAATQVVLRGSAAE